MSVWDDFRFIHSHRVSDGTDRPRLALVDPGRSKRKRLRKVTFSKPLVTKQTTIEATEEETPEEAIDRQLKQFTDEALARLTNKTVKERKALIKEQALSIRVNALVQHQFFKSNPLGVPNTPYHRDTTKSPHRLREEVAELREAVLKMLEFAPKVFLEAHPFTEAEVAYFTMIGPTKDNRRRYRIHKASEADMLNGNPLFVPLVFMPLELEKRLWNHRRKMLVSWYQSSVKKPEHRITYRDMIRHLQHSNFRSVLVPDPFQYFTQAVEPATTAI